MAPTVFVFFRLQSFPKWHVFLPFSAKTKFCLKVNFHQRKFFFLFKKQISFLLTKHVGLLFWQCSLTHHLLWEKGQVKNVYENVIKFDKHNEVLISEFGKFVAYTVVHAEICIPPGANSAGRGSRWWLSGREFRVGRERPGGLLHLISLWDL